MLTEVSTAGAETKTELAVATYKTLLDLKTKIDTISGWSCTLDSTDYNGEAASFLRPIYGQEAWDKSTADLVLPDDTASVKIVSEDMIELVGPAGFPRDTSQADTVPRDWDTAGFPEGIANIFVWFKAGYTIPTDAAEGTLPAGLELLVHEVVSDLVASRSINSLLQSERIGGYSYSLRTGGDGLAIASAIENRKKELNAYRRVSM